VEADKALGKASDARLLVWSVAPGSIDIAFLPDLASAAGLLASVYDPLKFVTDFATSVKDFVGLFRKDKPADSAASTSVKDCDDAINFAAPIANHGGSQTILVVKGDLHLPILRMNAQLAREVTTLASARKSVLQQSNSEVRERVPMVWSRLDRDKAKSEGQSPDKAAIEEIDPKSRPVFFTDAMSFLKDQMIDDEENPYQRVYFVDVEVSHIQGKVASYRVIRYHGKEDLD
jgi:hypothetical protein